jgi:type IV secretion system protein VirD4
MSRTVGTACAAGAGLLLSGALWTIIASAVSLCILGQLAYFQPPYWQWWQIRPYWVLNWYEALAVWGGAIVAFIPFAIIPAAFLSAWRNNWTIRMRPSLFWLWQAGTVQRGITDNHGHSNWMSMAELRRLFAGPDPKQGGVVVGEAYRVDQDLVANIRFDPRNCKTWGRGGEAPLLIDPCRDGSTHSLIFAGSGGFKTSCAATTLLYWTGSVVVLDPSCELAPMLTEARREMGHRVITLSPATPDVGVNVLDWIDINAPLAESHVHSVVSWICGERRQHATTGNDSFFESRGRQLVACLLAHILWDASLPAHEKTLRLLRKGVAQPAENLKLCLEHIHQHSKSPTARDLAGSLLDKDADETFSGIASNAADMTAWLAVGANADLVSGNAFRTSELTRGNLSVFVQIPLEALIHSPGVARTLVGALLNSVYRAEGKIEGRVLFLLDEAARLGRMTVLQLARDAGRKYGISLHLLLQSAGQLEDIWGQHEKRAWYDSVSWRAYAAIRDQKTAQEVSEAFGHFGVMAYSESDNSGRQGGRTGRSRGQNTNRHEIKRRLITPEELLQDTRTDELFVIAGGHPIRCGRAIWFRRADAESRIHRSRFAA